MGHFYDHDGKPQYTYNGKDTTLREARKFGWVPSVTEVLQVIAKPALVNWMQDQAIMAALTMPRAAGETEEVYISRIKADSKQQALNAAAKGTEIHDACETFVRDGVCREEYMLHAIAAQAELKRLFPHVADWVTEKSFAHPLGFGGKCDLHSPSTGIVVDYKTKDGDFSDGKKLAWDQHWQLAAYQMGLGLVDRMMMQAVARLKPIEPYTIHDGFQPCAAIFISRTHPGRVASHTWNENDIRTGWQVFHAALQLWKLLKGYDGGF